MRNSSNRLVFTVLAFFVIACFVLTHHLTLVLLVAALAVLGLSDQILSRRYPEFNLRSENVTIIFVVAAVAVFSYYAFVYFSPLQIILNTFTNQLALEVASAQPVSGWSFPVLLQRAFYILFIGFSVILAVFLARTNLRRFLSRFAGFFLLGSTFFVLAVAGQLIKAPYNWDMISIFGWFFFIPVTLAMVFACMDLPIPARRGILLFVSAVLVAALVFGNVYALPTNVLDHTGANEYQGARFKNWAKPQEFNSALWTIHYKNSGSQVVGDELVRRLYLSNSPNFTGNFKFIQFYNATSRDSVILIRNENSYQVIRSLYAAKGTQGGTFGANESITNLLSNQSLIRVYDDAEVRILSSHAP